MSDFKKLADEYYICGQITQEHISQASTDGFKSIINLRPDNEKPGYIDADKAAEVAETNKLKYHHLPVAMTGPLPDQVSSFNEIIEGCNGPVLVYCGSGKRAAILWALSNKGKISADDIIVACASCGHDLSKLRPHL